MMLEGRWKLVIIFHLFVQHLHELAGAQMRPRHSGRLAKDADSATPGTGTRRDRAAHGTSSGAAKGGIRPDRLRARALSCVGRPLKVGGFTRKFGKESRFTWRFQIIPLSEYRGLFTVSYAGVLNVAMSLWR